MADEYFEDFKSLVKAAESKVKIILTTDVTPVAENIFKKHIIRDIYGVYKPKPNGWVNGTTYVRRNELPEKIESTITDNTTLFVTSLAKASKSVVRGYSFRERYPGAFLKLLETGNMGIWKGGFPRPAVKNTQDEFDRSKNIENAIKRGIKREMG